MKAKKSPSLSELEEYFEIDESSPSGLRWKKKLTAKIKVGDVAGHPTEYYSVVFKKMKYRVHRIIYQLHHGLEILEGGDIVDHIDGNRLNNSVSNLRLVTEQQNRWNSARGDKLHKTSKRYHQITINLRKDQYSSEDAENLKKKILAELRGEYSLHSRPSTSIE
jgi:hypothetical protein